MSTKDQITTNSSKVAGNFKETSICIVVSQWNHKITDALSKAALATLISNGLNKDNISVIQVPGSFELPLGAKLINSKKNPDGIICLGCIIKGDTDHNRYIAQSVASGITMLSMSLDKPVIFGVLTCNDSIQARDRSGGRLGNKGSEAAITALKMIQLKEETTNSDKKIGF